MAQTHHARARAQQRGLPPFILEMFDRYGEEKHLGSGAVVRYLSKRGRRHMEQDLGRQPVAKLNQWLNSYEVCTTDGTTITIGHRTRRLRSKA